MWNFFSQINIPLIIKFQNIAFFQLLLLSFLPFPRFFLFADGRRTCVIHNEMQAVETGIRLVRQVRLQAVTYFSIKVRGCSSQSQASAR